MTSQLGRCRLKVDHVLTAQRHEVARVVEDAAVLLAVPVRGGDELVVEVEELGAHRLGGLHELEGPRKRACNRRLFVVQYHDRWRHVGDGEDRGCGVRRIRCDRVAGLARRADPEAGAAGAEGLFGAGLALKEADVEILQEFGTERARRVPLPRRVVGRQLRLDGRLHRARLARGAEARDHVGRDAVALHDLGLHRRHRAPHAQRRHFACHITRRRRRHKRRQDGPQGQRLARSQRSSLHGDRGADAAKGGAALAPRGVDVGRVTDGLQVLQRGDRGAGGDRCEDVLDGVARSSHVSLEGSPNPQDVPRKDPFRYCLEWANLNMKKDRHGERSRGFRV